MQLVPLDRESKKRLLKRLKFVFQEEEYKDLLSRVYQINADLATLTMQQTRPTEVQISKRIRTLPEAYNLVRQYTTKLHRLLFQEAPVCKCAVAHVVNLRLQKIILDKQGQNTGAVRFKILFSFDRKIVMISRVPSDWQEPEIQPAEATTATTAGQSTMAASSFTSEVLEMAGPVPVLVPQRKRDRFKMKLHNIPSLFDFRGRNAVSKISGENTLKPELSQAVPSAAGPSTVM